MSAFSNVSKFIHFIKRHFISFIISRYPAPPHRHGAGCRCGHCQRLAPEFARAAAELAGEGVPLGQVDATEEKGLAERFGVPGYPTLKVFHSGTPYDYEGPREAAGEGLWGVRGQGGCNL